MKKLKAVRAAKLIIFLVLALSLIFTAGCSPDKKASAGDQGESDPAAEGLAGFQTKDIYGNDVNQDIFKDYPLTLVNVWGTFCGPCLKELPYLGELREEYEPKGVNIVGIVVDAQDEEMQPIDEQLELARQIADETGANYTHMLVSTDMIDPVLNRFDAIPASFLVDSSGNIVSEFYIGSRSKEEWVDLIETNIEEQKSAE